jgi:hypothetical protein
LIFLWLKMIILLILIVLWPKMIISVDIDPLTPEKSFHWYWSTYPWKNHFADIDRLMTENDHFPWYWFHYNRTKSIRWYWLSYDL